MTLPLVSRVNHAQSARITVPMTDNMALTLQQLYARRPQQGFAPYRTALGLQRAGLARIRDDIAPLVQAGAFPQYWLELTNQGREYCAERAIPDATGKRSIGIMGVWSSLVVASGLLVGTLLGIIIRFNPLGLSSTDYVENHQTVAYSFHNLLPVMGILCCLSAGALVLLSRTRQKTFLLLIAATACFAAVVVTTLFVTHPISAEVMTWDARSPPGDWMLFRDKWWSWHMVRTLLVAIGCLLALQASRREQIGESVDVKRVQPPRARG